MDNSFVKVKEVNWLTERCQDTLDRIHRARGKKWEEAIFKARCKRLFWSYIFPSAKKYLSREEAIERLKNDDDDWWSSTYEDIWFHVYGRRERSVKEVVEMIQLYNLGKISEIYLTQDSLDDIL